MTEPGEPIRLLDDPSVDRGLRDALRDAAAHAPPLPADGLARLEAATSGGAGAGAVIAGLVALGVIAGGGAWMSGQGERAPGVERETVEAPALAPAIAPAPAAAIEPVSAPVAPPVSVDPEPVAGVEPVAVEPAAGAAPRASRPPREPAGDDGALAREMAQLATARRTLPEDPARALALLDDGARRYPESMFAEERSALRVLALAGLGRSEQARRDGERFLGEHPSSPFAARVRRAIAP